jgi:hypothetical protein
MTGRNRGARRVLLAACIVMLAAALAHPSTAGALPPPDPPFDYNEPFVRQVGPEVMVYDWSVSKCEDNDITDEAARAFRDDTNKVQLMVTHFVNYRWIANSTLDSSYTHPCTKTMSSNNDSNPATYNSKEWLASPWTPDGKTIYALVHHEFQGQLFHSPCSPSTNCWYNSITSAISTNSGATFTQAAAPNHLVATIPYQFAQDGPNGYQTPSNIVRAGDGYFYAMFRAESKSAQLAGTCLMRTRDLSDVTSWRAWNGSGFVVRFRNPYLAGTFNPANHVCAPVDPLSIGTLSESLTYNTYFRKWMLVGNSVGDEAHNKPPGVYYALSDNLLEWTDAALLMAAEITWVRDCDPPDPIKESSLLDPTSPSRNFETVGQRAQQFYTHYHLSGCNGTLNRDLIRVPIEFSNQQPGGPQAAMTASTRSAGVGEPVKLDASGSSDTDGGTVEKYEWDFDDDGRFDRDTGTNPVTSTSFPDPKPVTVRVRVSDDDGKYTDETEVIQVGEAAKPPARPAVCKRARWTWKRACRPRRQPAPSL